MSVPHNEGAIKERHDLSKASQTHLPEKTDHRATHNHFHTEIQHCATVCS